jgi:multidrug efflux system membrane fusion protein
VRIALAERRSVPVELDAIGTVTPVADVAVKSQIEGKIAQVHFREGQEVKPGDALFTIDPRSFEAALAQAQANLTRDRAQAERSRVDAERQAKLFAQGVASQQVVDTVRTQANVDAGAVRAGEAAVRGAELDLEHTRIDAPIGGRVGSLLVHEGDVVKANDTELVALNQIAPIDVRFTVPEQQLPAVQAALAAGAVPVAARPGGSAGAPETGQLVFVDNAVDRTTGTIALKARFENAERHLWPGQYVDVVMQIGTRADAVVVPEQAVQAGQDGALVFVIGADDKAQVRKVRVDLTHRGQSVIAEGIEPGDRVVVDGQLRLSPGAAVTVEEAPARVAGQPDGRS